MMPEVDSGATRPRVVREPVAAPRLPIVGNLPSYMSDPLKLFSTAARLGDVVDLGLPKIRSLLCSNPADINYVLIEENRKFIKEIFMRDFRRVLGNGLVTSEGDFWRRQRRLAQPAFARERIASYGDIAVGLAERYGDTIPTDRPFDLHAAMMRLTLEVVVRALFSSDIGDATRVVGDAMEAISERYSSPLYLVLPLLGRLPLARNRRFRDATARLDSLVYEIIARRRAGPAGAQTDLLSMLLHAQDADGSRMTDQQARDEVTTLVLAGHDTTANALAWAFFLLARHPAAAATLASELDSRLGDRPPAVDDLPHLTYTEYVVLETLRLYPPIWTIGREALETFELGGVRIPRGSQLYFSPWVVHRSGRHFEDPDAFRPERWQSGLAKRLPKLAYFPFGGGPRACIGGAFSMMEAKLVLAALTRRFQFSLAPDERGVPQASISLRPRNGLWMNAAPRRGQSACSEA